MARRGMAGAPGGPRMPVTYEIDREHALIRTRCVGYVTLAEVVDHFRALRDDASRPPRLDVLLDFTGTESVPDSDQLTTVAREIEDLSEKIEWGACAVVASGDLLFGISRMLLALAESQFQGVNVLRSLEDAEHWLASRRAPEV